MIRLESFIDIYQDYSCLNHYHVLDFLAGVCQNLCHATGRGAGMKSSDDDVTPLLRALVLLQLEAAQREDPDAKPELLLHRAGMSIADTAALLGKNYAAVAKAINRAKKAN